MAWSQNQQKAWNHQSNGPNSKGLGKHGQFSAHSRQSPAIAATPTQPWNPQEPMPQVVAGFPVAHAVAQSQGPKPNNLLNANIVANRTNGADSHRGSGGPSSMSARSVSDAGLDGCSTSSTQADHAGAEDHQVDHHDHDPRRHHHHGGPLLTTNPTRNRRGKGDGRNAEYDSHPDHVNSEGAQAGRNLLSMLRAGAPQQPESNIPRSEPQPLSTDEFQLWMMQAREDAEMGADVHNEETFGDDAGAKGWSFEENLAANERIHRLNQVRESREAENVAVERQLARLSHVIMHQAEMAPASLREALVLVMQKGWHNVRWPQDYTALHMAAEFNCPEVMPLLVTLGADPLARSVDGITALDVANHKGHRRCVEVLKQLASARSLEEVIVISARLSNPPVAAHVAPAAATSQDRGFFNDAQRWAEASAARPSLSPSSPSPTPSPMQPNYDLFERVPCRAPPIQPQLLHQQHYNTERVVPQGMVPQAYAGAPDASRLPMPRFARLSFAA